jgi:transcriptional regulator with GAF, ATPase, and Fis domain
MPRSPAAGKGTIFLDEIGNLSLRAQVALLRVLEKGEVSAIGEDLPRHIDVRIVAATNESLNNFRIPYRLHTGLLQDAPGAWERRWVSN